MLYGHLIAYKEFVYSGDLFDEKACIRRLFLFYARLTARGAETACGAEGVMIQ